MRGAGPAPGGTAPRLRPSARGGDRGRPGRSGPRRRRESGRAGTRRTRRPLRGDPGSPGSRPGCAGRPRCPGAQSGPVRSAAARPPTRPSGAGEALGDAGHRAPPDDAEAVRGRAARHRRGRQPAADAAPAPAPAARRRRRLVVTDVPAWRWFGLPDSMPRENRRPARKGQGVARFLGLLHLIMSLRRELAVPGGAKRASATPQTDACGRCQLVWPFPDPRLPGPARSLSLRTSLVEPQR